MKYMIEFDLPDNDTVLREIKTADVAWGIWGYSGCTKAKPAQRWIPCSERMPDEDYWTGANFQYSADVLMTVYNAEDEETIIDYGHTVGGSWYSDTTDCFVPSKWEVVAWMPLPKPWEGR